MERLTHQCDMGYYSPHTKDSLCQELGRYEDTGLTPLEIEDLKEKGSDTANIETSKETVLTKELDNNVTDFGVDFNTVLQAVYEYEKKIGGAHVYFDGYTYQITVKTGNVMDPSYTFVSFVDDDGKCSTLCNTTGNIYDPGLVQAVKFIRSKLA